MATVNAMQGLDPNAPTEISTTFAATVTVATWRVNDYGLVAVVTAGVADGGTDTYFVPWSQLRFARQHAAPVALKA